MPVPSEEKPIQIAGYHLRSEIARGGMGSVYRGYQISMDRVVAVKVLAAKFTEDAVFVERFLKEARAAARLNHPNIVQAIDVAQFDGRYYFVMEFVEGSTLSGLLKERGKLPPLEACGVIVQIARALEHASRFGMLHLDVKPGNIMVTPAGCAKLADFGLARHVEDEDTLYTHKKVIFGTPHYMSPEQISGTDLDARSDIYSLGVTFYETVVGRNPFSAPTTKEVLRKVKAASVPPAHTVEPAVSEDLSLVIQKMMSFDREQRYREPAQLLTDLDALSRLLPPPVARNLPSPETLPPPPPPPPEPRPRPQPVLARWAGIAVVLIFAAVVAVVVYMQTRPKPRHMPPPKVISLPAVTTAPQPPEADPAGEAFLAGVRDAEGLMADGKFKEALQVYDDFAARNTATPWAAEARRAATGVHARAGLYAGNLSREANAAISRGDYGVAKNLADQISALHLPETDPVAQEVQASLARAEAAAAQLAEENRLATASRALRSLQDDLAALIRDERFDAAVQRWQEFLSNPNYARLPGLPRNEMERVDWLQKIQSAILAGAARSVGRPLHPRPPGLGSTGIPDNAVVAGVSEGKVVLKLGAADRPLNLRDLAETDLSALARAGLSSPASRESLLVLHGGLALLLDGEGRPREAQRHLNEVRVKEGRLPPWLAEAEFNSLLGTAEQDLSAGRLSLALEHLRALRARHQHSRFYVAHITQIGDLLSRIRAKYYQGMVSIPAGRFTYQAGKHLDLPAYYMARNEVTNAEYARFLDYCNETQDRSFDHVLQPASKKDHVPLKWDGLSKGRPAYPVVGVDWYDAFAYANWLGKRLPTDTEWEKAARGDDVRKFPWGNDWEPKGKGRMCNAPPAISVTAEDMPSGVVAVGSFPQGRSPYLILDMAGNAREWIGDEATSVSEPNACTRGGSFADGAASCTTTARVFLPRETRDVTTGFRCAADPIADAP